MAKIRFTTELLEHLLDLPEGIAIVDVAEEGVTEVDHPDGGKVTVMVLEISGEGGGIDGWSDNDYALQYEEREGGPALVSAVPVPR